MSTQGGIDLPAAQASLRQFAVTLGDAASDMAASATTSVGGDIVRRIDGMGPNPRRVDTGETRDGWALATFQATNATVGPTSAAPPGGAVGEILTNGKQVRSTLVNLAPQAHYVEDGAPHMRPGYHVRDSSRNLEQHVEMFTDRYMVQAWENAG